MTDRDSQPPAGFERTLADDSVQEDEPADLETFGQYTILEELGRGGQGVVYLALDRKLNRKVALKMLTASAARSQSMRSRLLREAEAASKLDHPAICPVYDVGQVGDIPYIAMRFVKGTPLSDRIAARRTSVGGTEKTSQEDWVDEPPAPTPAEPPAGNLPDRESILDVTDFIERTARALHVAHEARLVHRDIKPGNIMVSETGEPVLLDFGLARDEESQEPTLTQAGQLMGTPGYMAPEQIAEQHIAVDCRTDVYALGATLYECLTLRRPFEAPTRVQLYKDILVASPPDPRRFNPRISKDLKVILEAALEKDPDRRYQSAAAFADDLANVLAGKPITARPPGAAERLWRWFRSNPVAAGFLLAVTIGSGVGFWYLSALSGQLVRNSAKDSVAMQTEMLNDVNAHYSANVVNRLKPHGVRITHDYADHDGAIPLPATFLTELAGHMSDKQRGMRVRHFSDFPFTFRKNGGARDDFDRTALARLRADPTQPHYSFEEFQGRYSLRFATARVMKQSCVDCHNNHPYAHPGKRWKVGDVRGVLEIIRPLDADVDRTRAGLREAFIILGGILALLVGLSVVFLAMQNRHHRAPSRGGITSGMDTEW